MKTTSQNTILAGIGAILILALVGMPVQNVEAEMDSTNVLYKLQSIQNEITKSYLYRKIHKISILTN